MNDTALLALGDNFTRTNIKYLLQELNLDIRETSHGAQAIRDAATLSPGLVIVDDTLSYLSGYQFCRLIKFGLHLEIPLILLISSQNNPDRFWGASCGADYCLAKPFNMHELKEIVNEILMNKKARKSFFQSPVIGQHTSDLDILKITNDLLDRHLFREKLLNELGSLNRQLDSVHDIVSAIMSVLGSLFFYRSAAIFLYYETKAELLISLNQAVGKKRLDFLYAALLTNVKKEEGLDFSLDDIPLTSLGPVSPEEEADVEEFEGESISIFFGENLRSLICYVAFDGLRHETFTEEEARIFQIIFQQVIEVLEEKIIFEKSIHFSIIDTNRNETNRSFFLKLLSQNMEQAKRFQIPLSLIVLDLENFPQIAKSLGKKAAFHFRQKIYQSLLFTIRKMDVIARIDQDRFALVLFKANIEQSRSVYQRIKILLEELSFPKEPLQIRGGFWTYDNSYGVNAEEFLKTACSQGFASPDRPQSVKALEKTYPDKDALDEPVAVVETQNAKK